MQAEALSPRQAQVLDLLREGCGTDCIADTLGISRWAARKLTRKLRLKLGADSMWQIPDAAREQGVP